MPKIDDSDRVLLIGLSACWALAGSITVGWDAVSAAWAGRAAEPVRLVFLASGWAGLLTITPFVLPPVSRTVGKESGSGLRDAVQLLLLGLAFTASWAASATVVLKTAVPTRVAMPVPEAMIKTWMSGFPESFLAFLLLVAAVRVVHRGPDGEDSTTEGSERTSAPFIRVPIAGGWERIPLEEVAWIESRGYQSLVHTSSGTFVTRESLTRLASRREAAGLLRVHRSFVVHVDAVARLLRDPGGSARVILVDGTTVPVSRRRRREVESALDAPGPPGGRS